MKRICIYCESWGSGGIESYLFNILTHMNLSGLEVDLIATRIGDSVFTHRLQERGINFYSLSNNPHNLLRSHKKFRDFLRENKYEAVYCNVFHSLSMWYLWASEKADVPVRIVHSHNSDLRPSATRQLKLLIHRIACWTFTPAATQLWTCSTPAMEFMFPKKVVRKQMVQFIPNGIETQCFCFDSNVRERIRTELCLQENFVIGNIGRLCSQKNQSFLLDVFQNVHERDPYSRLLLIGDGEDASSLWEKAVRLGIEDSVLFLGNRKDIAQLLWVMDVFVLPSHFEGLPVTAIEAQAAGLPCILSDCITKESAVTSCVFYVALEDGVNAWADAILQTRGKVVNRNRSNAIFEVQKKGFDIKDVAAYVEKYLRGQWV